MSTIDIVQKMAKKRTGAIKEEQEKNKQENSFTFDRPKAIGLSKEKPVIVRFPGNFYLVREKSTDMKKYQYSKIVSDKGYYTHISWPMLENGDPDKDWLLFRIFTELNRKDNKEFVYDTEEIFKCIKENRDKYAQFNMPFKPQHIILANVIDRMDDWCKKNRHSKLLYKDYYAKEYDRDGQTQVFESYFRGIPETGLLRVTDLIEVDGDRNVEFCDQDVILWRTSETPYIGERLGSHPEGMLGYNQYASLIKPDGPIEDEASYELYDIDRITEPTRYKKLWHAFQEKIHQAEIATGKKFFEELKDLYSAEKAQSGDKSDPGPTPDRNVTTTVEKSEGDETLLLKHYPKLNEINKTDQKTIRDGISKVTEDSVSFSCGTAPCNCEKKLMLPDTIDDCPACGESMVEE